MEITGAIDRGARVREARGGRSGELNAGQVGGSQAGV